LALIIFDYGGVLANDLLVSWSIISNIIASYGKRPDLLPEFRKNFKLPYWEYLQSKGLSRDVARFDGLPQRYVREYRQKMDNIDTFPEVSRVLKQLYSKNKLVVLSQTPRDIINEFLDSKGLLEYFAGICGLEDFKKHKPFPHPVYEILRTFQSSSKNTVMVGDMAQDIQSAKSAKIISVAVSKNESYHTKELLIKEKPHHLISDLNELENIVGRYNYR